MGLFTFRVFALVLAVTAAACSGEIDSFFPTTPDPVRVTETFSGTITINGAATHAFFTSTTGAVSATLISLGDNPPETIGLSLGTWSGAACSIVLAQDRATVSSVVTATVSTLGGSLCVRIYDVGSLSAAVPYEVRVDHP